MSTLLVSDIPPPPASPARTDGDRHLKTKLARHLCYLLAAAAHNLGRILQGLFGVGKAKSLQGLRTLASLAQLTEATLGITTATVYDRLVQSLRNSLLACHDVLTQMQTTVRSTDC